MKSKFTILFFLTTILLLLAPPAKSADEGWFVVERRTDGQSDLWAMSAIGGPWQRLTKTPEDERWPAWHPDGHTLAYAARRNQNWDIYTLDLRTGQEKRLTSNPHFDGWPAWSPDGTQIAFASSREKDLDLFLFNLKTKQETNLTPDSQAHEFEPHWIDKDNLLFVSTRNRTSHDLFRLRLKDGAVKALTASEELNERQPISLKGKKLFLAVVKEDRTNYLTKIKSNGGYYGKTWSWSGSVFSVAIAPQSDRVAWLERRLSGDMLYQRGVHGGPIQLISGPTPHLDNLTWGMPKNQWMHKQFYPPMMTRSTRQPSPRQSSLIRLNNLNTEQPRLNQHVVSPFNALRTRIKSELGQDFLGSVTEIIRVINFNSNESDYLSWHKSGRAIDTLLDLGWDDMYQKMEIIREDLHDDIYWRIWLRCPKQDGSCGEPLIEQPWDFSYEARWIESTGQGGQLKSFKPGYYVDFTRLAEDEGWARIPAYETPGFDWRQNKIATEFWHYQYTDGLNWYEAMSELYSSNELAKWFGWTALRKQEIPLWKVRAKGLPLLPEMRNLPVKMVTP